MRIAYADPPYLGQAHKYKNHSDYNGEVDHTELIARLKSEFSDGWALSASASSLSEILALIPDARIAVWCKSNAMPVPNQRITWSWEAVLFKDARPNQLHTRDYIRDYLVSGHKGGFLGGSILGEKPKEFCYWLFGLLGLKPEDEFVDLFPGSGAVTKYWEQWCSR